jgi:hypothetical protein
LPQRATGTSVDPNALGGLLIMMLTLTTPQLFAPRPLLKRRWIVIGLGLLGLALLLSFSRGSFLGAGGALFLLGVVRYRKILVIGIVALALILLLPQTQGYVTHFFDRRAEIDSALPDLWRGLYGHAGHRHILEGRQSVPDDGG